MGVGGGGGKQQPQTVQNVANGWGEEGVAGDLCMYSCPLMHRGIPLLTRCSPPSLIGTYVQLGCGWSIQELLMCT